MKNAKSRIRVFFRLHDVDAIPMIYICKCTCMWATIVNLRAELHVDETNETLNYTIEYQLSTAHNQPEKFQIWNYGNCFVKKLQYYTYMYGSDYSNYSLTICWIKKLQKLIFAARNIIVFLNALQNEINYDNEKHLTLFVHLLDADFY